MAAQGPPQRIETERLVIRCWDVADAALLKDAVDSSLDHLRLRMPWARNEPEDLNRKIERLRKWRADFDAGRDFFYGIFSRDETRVLGGSGLHTRRGPGILELGYWIRADSINQGLATETAAALSGCTPCAIDPVATHFFGNRQKRTPEILGTIVNRFGWMPERVSPVQFEASLI
jgi:RimJ/RimL family protein N-acetyltransferase